MLLRRISTAASLPVATSDAREHLRLTGSGEDYLIEGILASACDLIGQMAGRVLTLETWEGCYPRLSGRVQLPKSPVIAVTGISYFDQNDTSQPVLVSDFYLFKDDDYSFLQPKSGNQWPVAKDRDDGITITFTAGYAILPPALRAAVLMTAGHLYENRSASVIGETVATLPMAVEDCVAVHRLGWAGA